MKYLPTSTYSYYVFPLSFNLINYISRARVCVWKQKLMEEAKAYLYHM